MKRCHILVAATVYRAAGQCDKRHNIRTVAGVPICAHHEAAYLRGRRLEVVSGAGPGFKQRPPAATTGARKLLI